MDRSVLWIAIGSLLIVMGGIAATYGWDLRSSRDTRRMLVESRNEEAGLQRSALLRTLAAETMLNLSILNDSAYTTTDPQEIQRFIVFPRVQTTAMTSAIASASFVKEDDKGFFTSLVDLLERTTDFNGRLGITEMAMQRGSIAEHRTKLSDGAVIKDVRAHLSAFGRDLIGMGISVDSTFFVKK